MLCILNYDSIEFKRNISSVAVKKLKGYKNDSVHRGFSNYSTKFNMDYEMP